MSDSFRRDHRLPAAMERPPAADSGIIEVNPFVTIFHNSHHLMRKLPISALPLIRVAGAVALLTVASVLPFGLRLFAADYFPQEDTAPIWRNPGKGWVFYGSSLSGLTAAELEKGNLLYTRFSWSDIEPAEGQYNWTRIDNAIKVASDNGIKFAFGVMVCFQSSTPQWVFDAGARWYEPDVTRPIGEPVGGRNTIGKIPYWTENPVFFEKQRNFVLALGKKYDGNPNVEFVDVRNYGMLGEGHLYPINISTTGETMRYATVEELEQFYLAPYIEAFRKTRFVIPWGIKSHVPAYKWAVAQGQGHGMRRDGVPVYEPASAIAFAHGHGPAVIEYQRDRASMIAEGYWKEDVVSAAILDAKASFCQISGWSSDLKREFLEGETSLMNGLINKIGYHLVMSRLSIANPICADTTVPVSMEWENKGITYLYNDCSVALALLNANNQVVAKRWLSGVSPKKNWVPGPISVESSVSFPTVTPGSYKLAIGLFTSTSAANPD